MKLSTPIALALAVVVSTPAFAGEDTETAFAEIEATVEAMQKARQNKDRQRFQEHVDELYEQTGAFLDEHLDAATSEQLDRAAGAWLQIADMKEDTEALEARIQTLKGHEGISDDLRRRIAGLEAQLAIKPGEPAPDWTATDVHSGEEVTLESLKGEVVLMDFWATWCGPCKTLMKKELAPLFEKYADQDGFQLVGLGVPWQGETAEKQAEFSDEHEEYGWTKVFDESGEAARSYGVRGIPFLCLVDEEGTILHAGTGFQVISDVKETLAERFGGGEGEGGASGK